MEILEKEDELVSHKIISKKAVSYILSWFNWYGSLERQIYL